MQKVAENRDQGELCGGWRKYHRPKDRNRGQKGIEGRRAGAAKQIRNAGKGEGERQGYGSFGFKFYQGLHMEQETQDA